MKLTIHAILLKSISDLEIDPLRSGFPVVDMSGGADDDVHKQKIRV